MLRRSDIPRRHTALRRQLGGVARPARFPLDQRPGPWASGVQVRRNRRSSRIGIGARVPPESVFKWLRNTHPFPTHERIEVQVGKNTLCPLRSQRLLRPARPHSTHRGRPTGHRAAPHPRWRRRDRHARPLVRSRTATRAAGAPPAPHRQQTQRPPAQRHGPAGSRCAQRASRPSNP